MGGCVTAAFAHHDRREVEVEGPSSWAYDHPFLSDLRIESLGESAFEQRMDFLHAPEQRNEASSPRGSKSLRTHRWRELDSNFQFRDVSVPADSRAPAEFGGERRLVK